MKKFIAVAVALVFICACSTAALAAVSPIAPTIETTRPTTAFNTTTAPAPTTARTTAAAGDDRTTDSQGGQTTTDAAGNDRTTTGPSQTAQPDTNPSSPDTGLNGSAGKTVAAAIITIASLSAVGAYVSKKKVTDEE